VCLYKPADSQADGVEGTHVLRAEVAQVQRALHAQLLAEVLHEVHVPDEPRSGRLHAQRQSRLGGTQALVVAAPRLRRAADLRAATLRREDLGLCDFEE
jgi:hypothetical protein